MRLLILALMAGTLTLASCGKKGDPIPPGQQQTETKPKE